MVWFLLAQVYILTVGIWAQRSCLVNAQSAEELGVMGEGSVEVASGFPDREEWAKHLNRFWKEQPLLEVQWVSGSL